MTQPETKMERNRFIISHAREFLGVLNFEYDVTPSCSICPLMASAVIDTGEIGETFDNASVTCKKCILQFARRKHALLYIREFLHKSGKKYFKTDDITRYISQQFTFHEYIRPYLQRIITELVSQDVVKIYKHHGNGNRYFIETFNTTTFDEMQPFLIKKKYGFRYGYEKIEN